MIRQSAAQKPLARLLAFAALALAFAFAGALSAPAQHGPQLVKPMAGPRATALQVTWLYVTPSLSAQKLTRVQIGREMVVAERSGPWMRVYANTDIEEDRAPDQPIFGDDNSAPPPISGWIQAKGIVEASTPNGDQILMGAAANQEALAVDPRGPQNAAQSAHLLYRRLAEMFPNSPLAGQAAWRAADIQWQIQKADLGTLPSAHSSDPALREEMDESRLKDVIKYYPHTRWADLAAFDLISNKLCGDWQGSPKCPAKEAKIYEKYADEYPDGPRTARALYEAAYRESVLADMFHATGDDRKSNDAHQDAQRLAAALKAKFSDSDYAWRAAALVYKLDQGIPDYGIDQ
ncbi:MAG TPA: hypothetical protein VND90_06715 [Terracidiphilus sp.]|nr:hypothetical protein [Terracidiphilus sp.]